MKVKRDAAAVVLPALGPRAGVAVYPQFAPAKWTTGAEGDDGGSDDDSDDDSVAVAGAVGTDVAAGDVDESPYRLLTSPFVRCSAIICSFGCGWTVGPLHFLATLGQLLPPIFSIFIYLFALNKLPRS